MQMLDRVHSLVAGSWLLQARKPEHPPGGEADPLCLPVRAGPVCSLHVYKSCRDTEVR